jgi:hypothetical protein
MMLNVFYQYFTKFDFPYQIFPTIFFTEFIIPKTFLL